MHALKNSPNAAIDKRIILKYRDLPIPCGKILATYVWIDGTGEKVRSKDRVLDFVPKEAKDLPIWNYDGSSTYQTEGANSDTFLFPQQLYHDPFRKGNNMIVLCDTYLYDYTATNTNHRKLCEETVDKCKSHEVWFGIEQEYYITGLDGRPFGWPEYGFPAPPGEYYCGVGSDKAYVRDLAESHYRACLYAGVPICGASPASSPAQWRYQIGPAAGVRCADDLWMSRYILGRIGEEFALAVSLNPLPVEGWPGSGASHNFSTEKMRDDNGILEIEKAIDKLSKTHAEHIKVYDPNDGADCARRAKNDPTAINIKDFTAGVANRKCSVRIPRAVAEEKRGYFEDRRPASNCDPYRVCNILMQTCLLNGETKGSRTF